MTYIANSVNKIEAGMKALLLFLKSSPSDEDSVRHWKNSTLIEIVTLVKESTKKNKIAAISLDHSNARKEDVTELDRLLKENGFEPRFEIDQGLWTLDPGHASIHLETLRRVKAKTVTTTRTTRTQPPRRYLLTLTPSEPPPFNGTPINPDPRSNTVPRIIPIRPAKPAKRLDKNAFTNVDNVNKYVRDSIEFSNRCLSFLWEIFDHIDMSKEDQAAYRAIIDQVNNCLRIASTETPEMSTFMKSNSIHENLVFQVSDLFDKADAIVQRYVHVEDDDLPMAEVLGKLLQSYTERFMGDQQFETKVGVNPEDQPAPRTPARRRRSQIITQVAATSAAVGTILEKPVVEIVTESTHPTPEQEAEAARLREVHNDSSTWYSWFMNLYNGWTQNKTDLFFQGSAYVIATYMIVTSGYEVWRDFWEARRMVEQREKFKNDPKGNPYASLDFEKVKEVLKEEARKQGKKIESAEELQGVMDTFLATHQLRVENFEKTLSQVETYKKQLAFFREKASKLEQKNKEELNQIEADAKALVNKYETDLNNSFQALQASLKEIQTVILGDQYFYGIFRDTVIRFLDIPAGMAPSMYTSLLTGSLTESYQTQLAKLTGPQQSSGISVPIEEVRINIRPDVNPVATEMMKTILEKRVFHLKEIDETAGNALELHSKDRANIEYVYRQFDMMAEGLQRLQYGVTQAARFADESFKLGTKFQDASSELIKTATSMMDLQGMVELQKDAIHTLEEQYDKDVAEAKITDEQKTYFRMVNELKDTPTWKHVDYAGRWFDQLVGFESESDQFYELVWNERWRSMSFMDFSTKLELKAATFFPITGLGTIILNLCGFQVLKPFEKLIRLLMLENGGNTSFWNYLTTGTGTFSTFGSYGVFPLQYLIACRLAETSARTFHLCTKSLTRGSEEVCTRIWRKWFPEVDPTKPEELPHYHENLLLKYLGYLFGGAAWMLSASIWLPMASASFLSEKAAKLKHIYEFVRDILFWCIIVADLITSYHLALGIAVAATTYTSIVAFNKIYIQNQRLDKIISFAGEISWQLLRPSRERQMKIEVTMIDLLTTLQMNIPCQGLLSGLAKLANTEESFKQFFLSRIRNDEDRKLNALVMDSASAYTQRFILSVFWAPFLYTAWWTLPPGTWNTVRMIANNYGGLISLASTAVLWGGVKLARISSYLPQLPSPDPVTLYNHYYDEENVRSRQVLTMHMNSEIQYRYYREFQKINFIRGDVNV